MTGKLSAAFPGSPVVDTGTGAITEPWRGFLLRLYARTGGAVGASTTDTAAAVAANAAAAAAATAEVSAALVQEAQYRVAGDTALSVAISEETAARRATASTGGTSLAAEATTRAAADAALAASMASSVAAVVGALPLCNGDLPGPSFMADPAGCAIGVPA
jgi:hypothetical protein